MRKNYLWYQFFRYGLVKPALNMFYSDISVKGAEHIPQDKPIIFIPNHQNSFLDALHIVTNTNLFIHFLTRAKPFRQPILGYFLRSLNMLPVYRMRDGFGTISNNTDTFDECYEILKKNDSLLVFAEASHELQRRIRPLSKGFTRIVFGAEERNNWALDIQIIPVGINYGEHQKSRTPVHIEYGKVIALSQFKNLYVEDEREAAQQLKKVVAQALKKLSMHVPKVEQYPLHYLLLDKLEKDRESLLRPDIVNTRVKLIANSFGNSDLMKAEQLLDKAESEELDLREFVSPIRAKLKDLLLSPLYIFSLINNVLPYQAVRWAVNDYIEDHAFDASAKFLVGLFLMPVYYLIVATVFGFYGLPLVGILGYVLLSLVTAPLFVRAKDLLLSSNVKKLKKGNPKLYEEIKAKVEEFMEMRKGIFEKESVMDARD